MGKKPIWVQVLFETVGLFQLVAFALGVPAMIAFTSVIWHSLSPNQQILATVFVCLIVLAVALFIYGQTRKALYVIPTLLYQMRCRSAELACGLNIKTDDVVGFASLAGVDIPDTISSLLGSSEIERLGSLDTESLIKDSDFREFIKQVANTVPEQVKHSMELDEGIMDRVPRYMSKAAGLDSLLSTDKIYQKLSQRLDSLRPLIPTAEISISVNKYIRAIRMTNSLSPILQAATHSLVFEAVPLELTTDISGIPDSIEDFMATLLAEVREGINKYYKGN